MIRIVLLVLTLFFASVGFAKETKISQSQAIVVELRDPNGEEDERMIRVKEVESGKVTQLTLEKDPTTPQVWNGHFIIQFFKGDTSTRTLDFLTSSSESFYAYIFQDKAVQKVILFKTPEELALHEASITEAKQKEAAKELAKQIQVVARKKGPDVPVDKGRMEQLLRQQKLMHENTQLSFEESQAKKRMALLEQQQKMTEAQKTQKKSQAADVVRKADAFYKRNNFRAAEKLYSQATELDPESDAYYYRYGISLYRIGNYNKSLAIFSLTEVDADQALEKDYYIALNNFKLKDFDKARKGFIEIREENSKELSPVASYYAGMIEFQQQKYPDARKSMEYVIDNSKDPKMDRSAETMLEQIDRFENFYESKKEKFRFTLIGGLVYDSNILNIAENNVATDLKAVRLNYGVSALAIWYRSMTADFGTQLAVSDYYSMNSSLKGDATMQTADAMDLSISLPYHQEFKISKRQMNLEVIPAYRNIYMSPTGGTREVVIRSTELSTSLSTALKADLFLSGRLDLGSDQSLLSSSVGDDDLSGTRIGITLSPIKMLDLKGEKSFGTDLGYLINNTKGKNNRYSKTSLALNYGYAAFSKGIGGLRAEYALQNYADATTPRKDNSLSLTASYTKDFSKKWNMLLSAQLTNANSDNESYKYNKYLITSLFTYTHSILDK